MILLLTTTKLLDFFRVTHRHLSLSHAAECVQNERRTMFAPHTDTLLFEQHNKQFGSNFKNFT